MYLISISCIYSQIPTKGSGDVQIFCRQERREKIARKSNMPKPQLTAVPREVGGNGIMTSKQKRLHIISQLFIRQPRTLVVISACSCYQGLQKSAMLMSTKLSAIDVTPKIFFERLYWFQD